MVLTKRLVSLTVANDRPDERMRITDYGTRLTRNHTRSEKDPVVTAKCQFSLASQLLNE